MSEGHSSLDFVDDGVCTYALLMASAVVMDEFRCEVTEESRR